MCVKPSMFVQRQMILVLVTCLLYPDETRPRKEWSPWSSGGNSLHLRRTETSNDPAPCYKRTDVVINPVRGRQIHCLSLEIWMVIWDIHASNYWVTVPAHSPEALCSSEFWSIGLYSRYSRTSIFLDFDVSWLVPTNCELASQLHPPSFHCAEHFQLSQVLTFMN